MTIERETTTTGHRAGKEKVIKMMWVARAEYADGESFEIKAPYIEEGNASMEQERQYSLEESLLSHHEDCVWYSVELEEK